jgi:hypothetical protein
LPSPEGTSLSASGRAAGTSCALTSTPHAAIARSACSSSGRGTRNAAATYAPPYDECRRG